MLHLFPNKLILWSNSLKFSHITLALKWIFPFETIRISISDACKMISIIKSIIKVNNDHGDGNAGMWLLWGGRHQRSRGWALIAIRALVKSFFSERGISHSTFLIERYHQDSYWPRRERHQVDRKRQILSTSCFFLHPFTTWSRITQKLSSPQHPYKGTILQAEHLSWLRPKQIIDIKSWIDAREKFKVLLGD